MRLIDYIRENNVLADGSRLKPTVPPEELVSYNLDESVYTYLTEVSSQLFSLDPRWGNTILYPFSIDYHTADDDLIYVCNRGCSNDIYLGLKSGLIYYVWWDDYSSPAEIDWSVVQSCDDIFNFISHDIKLRNPELWFDCR